ncbi:MAG: HypC/HybG/HupF family hydrogenase formation chaperone [Candidatus Omnitrophica bacterium]|nr:HypC/HybG/HupF family hydrogenase formation chaperone [Candidatus Omnitrophota bacterium]
MCYAIPGKVESVEAQMVVVDYFGEKKKARNELPNLAVGDYVYAQGGYVITKVSKQEAEESLSGWKELFFSLKDTDDQLVFFAPENSAVDRRVARIVKEVSQGKEISPDELKYLIQLSDESQLDILFKSANFLRHKYHGNACCVHGIIEISNNCRKQCGYCGISIYNRQLKRYRMSKPEIIAAVEEAVNKYGFKALILQSGEGAYSVAELADIIKQIKQDFSVLIFISFGEIGQQGLAELYQAGARGLLMRFETSNPDLYRKIHPGQELDSRLEEIRQAYQMGYLIITGALIGLPAQTDNDIINDILLARTLNAEMFSFGPFIAHAQTPLAAAVPPAEEKVLKVLAAARFAAAREAKILVTTGFETLSSRARQKGLVSGGNSVMLNVTPLRYRGFYAIYPNRAHESETVPEQIDETVKLLKSLGRAPTDLGVGVVKQKEASKL